METTGHFTPRAQEAIDGATFEAAQLGHQFVGTEHVLLALLRSDNAVTRLFEAADLDPQVFVDVIVSRVGVAARRRRGTPQQTPALLDLLATAIADAERRHEAVDERVLFNALIASEGAAGAILRDAGFEPISVRPVASLVAHPDDAPEPAQPTPAAPAAVNGTPILDRFGSDLTKRARDGKLDPVIGRDREIERAIQVLMRRTKNNPVFLGDTGVGKTAIVEGIAQRIASGDVPPALADHRLVAVDVAGLVAGTNLRGMFEERMQGLLAEATKAGNIILFIDELHTILGAGGRGLDVANMLKPVLSRGQVACIGATTRDEFSKYVERDAALARRFQAISVDEPSIDDAIAILRGLRPTYERYHHVSIPDAALEAAARLAASYIHGRHLPDSAIDIVDESATRAAIFNRSPMPDRVKQARTDLQAVKTQYDRALAELDYEQTYQATLAIARLESDLRTAEKQWRETDIPVVNTGDVAQVVSMMTGVPVPGVVLADGSRLMGMEAFLERRVFGQQTAIATLARAVRRGRAGLRDRHRPVGSFLFLGPSGCGKTMLAVELANYLYGEGHGLVRIDMSDFMEAHSVSRLVGAPPGYVGYEEGGRLTDAVRRHPACVILFDDIDKAHPDVLNLLLQVLEDGALTDGGGNKANFAESIIIMTSTVGSAARRSIGFGAGDARNDASGLRDLGSVWRPEFLNRIDEVVHLAPLSDEVLDNIINQAIDDTTTRAQVAGVHLEVTAEARRFIGVVCDRRHGARLVRGEIERLLEDPLAEAILAHRLNGQGVRVAVGDGRLIFEPLGGELVPFPSRETEQAAA